MKDNTNSLYRNSGFLDILHERNSPKTKNWKNYR